MKVVIFCGGQGLRMGDSSASIPKPMVPVGNRPILWHIMKYYAHFGHKDFILCLGYRSEVIKKFFLDYDEALSNDFVLSSGGKEIDVLRSDIADWRITFVDTGLSSNVGQRLKGVAHLLEDDEMFLATYGDGLTDAYLPDLIDTVVRREKLGLLLCAQPTNHSLHMIRFGDDDHVAGITDLVEANIWINAGFFVLRREVLDLIGDGEDLVQEPFSRLITSDQLIGFRYDGFWAPMDTLKDKHNLEALAEGGNPPWAIWTAAEDRSKIALDQR